MKVLTVTTLALWGIVTIKNILFWTYLWQIKEYRLDRMKVHFELASSKKLILNKRTIWLVALLVLLLIPHDLTNTLTVVGLLLFYGFFATRGIQQWQNKTLKTPKRTLHATIIVFFSLFLYATVSTSFFLFAEEFLLLWVIAGDILAPLFIFLSVSLFQPAFSYMKNRFIKKAVEKRKKLKDLLVIGITGSYGKSSMKDILFGILSEEFNVLKTPENINVDIGIARVILKNLNQNHDIFIAEMGAYRKGEIAKSAEMVKPQIGVLTGLNQQHLSLFGSMDNIKEAKYELIESLGGKGLAVFNGDNEIVRELSRKHKGPKRIYAVDPLVDQIDQKIMVEHIKNTSAGLEIKIHEKDGAEEVLKTPLLGRHNAINILGAVTVARELGMGYKSIKAALVKLQPPSHTLKIKKGIKDSVIIDDTYSANLNGVLAALDVLATIKGRQKLFILQPLIELGAEAEKVHQKIAARAAEVCNWCIITSRDNFSVFYKEALDNGMSKDAIFCIPNSREALRKAQELTDKDDVILLENRIHPSIIEGLMLHKE
ncbi:MAG: UDP-N-acetylmuramoyl-tripeptide--D-alanyl-D-alanine ligase [Candidatus Spechtbacterales bacterium]